MRTTQADMDSAFTSLCIALKVRGVDTDEWTIGGQAMGSGRGYLVSGPRGTTPLGARRRTIGELTACLRVASEVVCMIPR